MEGGGRVSGEGEVDGGLVERGRWREVSGEGEVEGG